MILAGDIGGTNTRLGYFDLEGGRPKNRVLEIFPSKKSQSLEEIVAQFIQKQPQTIQGACFGIAGPILNGICTTPNLPWVVDARKLAQLLHLDRVDLINDLEANAHGISVLQPADLVELHPGKRDLKGNAGLISAGTGLGEAGLHCVDGEFQPFASEGGHVDFAPRNETEIALLQYLLKKFEHVSFERVLSGPGLINIHRFLVDTGRGAEPAWLRDQLAKENPGAVITKAALDHADPVCEQAMDIFVSIYGAEAGNLALKLLATGGVFLGGGMAPRIVSKLQQPAFKEAFWSKGRMTKVLKDIPIQVIVNDKTALLGAARVALLGVRITKFMR